MYCIRYVVTLCSVFFSFYLVKCSFFLYFVLPDWWIKLCVCSVSTGAGWSELGTYTVWHPTIFRFFWWKLSLNGKLSKIHSDTFEWDVLWPNVVNIGCWRNTACPDANLVTVPCKPWPLAPLVTFEFAKLSILFAIVYVFILPRETCCFIVLS